jgi:TonB-dependent starch-binding outer membrane protein SusC
MVLEPLCNPLPASPHKGGANAPVSKPGMRLLTSKMLLIMKITAFLLLVACLQVSAKSYSQITIKEKNAPLTKLFRELQKQSGYDFLYSATLIKDAGTSTVELHDVSLQQAIEECLKGKQLTYTIVEKTVIIRKKEEAPLPLPVTEVPPAITVSGRVTNEAGEPLAGVSVTVKGTTNGTTTNANGEYTLTNVDENATLVFTATNIEAAELKVNKRETVSLVAKTKVSPLDEIQVIAYGTTTKRLNTGNVTTITSKEIEKQPVNNPLFALAGRVPGLSISQASGMPGSGVQINIQGQNSIGNGNTPFYVVDGVPYIGQLLPNLGNTLGLSQSGGFVGNTTGNPLSFINPNDIASIEILKDADATAIYGSRAANGAILITTKRGHIGQTQVDFNIQTGIGQVARKMKLLNTEQYLEIRKESYINDGNPIPDNSSVPDPSNYDLTVWDQNRYTDWQEELLGNTARYTNAQLTVTGGSENTQYLIGAGYHKETTVFPGDLNDQKKSLNFSINSKSVNNKFHISLTGNYLIDNNKLSSVDLTELAMKMPPNMPALLNEDGSLNWGRSPDGTPTIAYTTGNPLAYLNKIYTNRTTNAIANINLSYKLFSSLTLKLSAGYNNLQSDEVVTNPASTLPSEFASTFNRTAQYNMSGIDSWVVEPQVLYKKIMGWGQLNLTIGGSLQKTNSDRKLFEGSGYSNDLVLENINAAQTIVAGYDATIASVYKYSAVFGRLNYNLKDKFILNLTTRRDGTSRYGSENRFHTFGAVGAAWIFSKEKFINENLGFLSFGKLRLSYGTTGSDQVSDYGYLSIYNNINPANPYSGGTGLRPSRLTNPFLQWEETKKFSAGIDVGLFNDHVLVNLNYFRNRSTNQLVDLTLPPSTGFGSILGNRPAVVQNHGWEISLGSTIISSKKITWASSINLTIPRNELVSFEGLSTSAYALALKIGEPISVVTANKFLGVNSTTGTYEFLDKNGTITTNPDAVSGNKTEFINTAQTLFGGFQNSISYKAFSLDLLFQYVRQKALSDRFGLLPGTIILNQPTSVLDRWQKQGDHVSVQRFFTSNFNYYFPWSNVTGSDAAYVDASFIRLKNISLSWRMPDTWKNKMHLQQARLFANGQNLLTITKFPGLDPETKSSSRLPPLRVITFGIQITL